MPAGTASQAFAQLFAKSRKRTICASDLTKVPGRTCHAKPRWRTRERQADDTHRGHPRPVIGSRPESFQADRLRHVRPGATVGARPVRQPIEVAPALNRLFDPRPLDPATRVDRAADRATPFFSSRSSAERAVSVISRYCLIETGLALLWFGRWPTGRVSFRDRRDVDSARW
jgi:hypothetical protein